MHTPTGVSQDYAWCATASASKASTSSGPKPNSCSKKRKQLDYLMNVKGNRPGLQAAVFAKLAPLTLEGPDDVISERARGRIRKWSCWITRASQVALIRRDVFEISGQPVSKEIALMITSRKAAKMTVGDVNKNTRNHWGIENKSHYVRDTVYREDHNQT